MELNFQMAAFNWIVFDGVCPKCLVKTTLRAQCHIGASFDGENGKIFCNGEYKLGEKMRWWPINHPRWRDWITSDRRNTGTADVARECCYTECQICGADLYAVIEFVSLSPRLLIDIGLEENWPKGFDK